MSHCANCKSKIKSGLLGTNELYSPEDTAFVNAFSSKEHEQLCFTCGTPFLEEARRNLGFERRKIVKLKEALISTIPVVSIENPPDWKYETLGMVNERLKITTTMTGQIKMNDVKCFNKLKERANALGANAIVGCQVHYTSYQSGYYFLINTFGTAVKVKDTSILPKAYFDAIQAYDAYEEMIALVKRYEHIKLF